MEIQLELVKGQDGTGEDITEIKTFTNNKVKSRILRNAIELSETMNFNDLKGTDIDLLVDFICGIYHDKFTRNEFYDGLPANLMIDTVTNIIEDIVNGAVDKLDTFPEK